MNLELEAKFLNVKKDSLRELLANEGFKLVAPEYMMKRKTFHFPGETQNKWGRVRTESSKITMTIKEVFDKSRIDGTREVELVVDDFDKASSFMETLGLKTSAYQENMREKWEKGEIEVTIDTWPGLNPYVEIEGPTEEAVKAASSALGFDFSQAVFGSSDVVYEKVLGIPSAVFIKLPEVTFANPPTK